MFSNAILMHANLIHECNTNGEHFQGKSWKQGIYQENMEKQKNIVSVLFHSNHINCVNLSTHVIQI